MTNTNATEQTAAIESGTFAPDQLAVDALRLGAAERFASELEEYRQTKTIRGRKLSEVATRVLGMIEQEVGDWEVRQDAPASDDTVYYRRVSGQGYYVGPQRSMNAWLQRDATGRVVAGALEMHNGHTRSEQFVHAELPHEGREKPTIEYAQHQFHSESDGVSLADTYGAAAGGVQMLGELIRQPLEAYVPKPEPQVDLSWTEFEPELAEKLFYPVEIPYALRDLTSIPTTSQVLDAFRFTAPLYKPDYFNDFQRFLAQQYGTVHGFPRMNELYTQEYVHELGTRLGDRIRELGGSPEEPVKMVELAAGLGYLSYFLDRKLQEFGLKDCYTLTATDLAPYHDPAYPPSMEVQAMDYKAALRDLQPDIVLAAWVPSDNGTRHGNSLVDWSVDIRASGASDYIYIGDPLEHGTPETLGQRDLHHRGESAEGEPRYAQEGFTLEWLDDLAQYQFGYSDWAGDRRSRTGWFRHTQ